MGLINRGLADMRDDIVRSQTGLSGWTASAETLATSITIAIYRTRFQENIRISFLPMVSYLKKIVIFQI